ncbi:MAG: uracil-DNA glycosylase [Thaumarchaeota archaeon]|nr:uracil-DNA glycosylase [Nitrososphaerota archaeon]
MTDEAVLQELAREIRSCVKCPLHLSRRNAVPGEGPSDATLMIIGEAPGRNEDEQGRPFVGAAGRNLDDLLSEAGVSRDSVFITNTVKCRPPANRRPARDELDACHPYLRRQTEAIAPKVIVLLGDAALKEFFPGSSLGQVHGKTMKRGSLLFFSTYHPASVIYNPSLKEVLKDDFRKLGALTREGKV